MTDVRLTIVAEDGQVYPVLGNTKGELKLEEPTINSDDYVAKAGDNMTGALTIGPEGGPAVTSLAADGKAEFAGDVSVGNDDVLIGKIGYVQTHRGNPGVGVGQFTGGFNGVVRFQLTPEGALTLDDTNASDATASNIYLDGRDGTADFAGDVVIGSRNKKWMIVESGGIAHLVEQTRIAEQAEPWRYPELRNIPRELDLVEQALQDVMEKLRMNPPAGWPVWDGSDED